MRRSRSAAPADAPAPQIRDVLAQLRAQGRISDPHVDNSIVELRNEVEDMFRPRDAKRSEQMDVLTASGHVQKWCDLTMGEIEDQLSTSCTEQGRLVRKLRRV